MPNMYIRVLMMDIGGVVAPFEPIRFGEALMPYVNAGLDERARKSAEEINALIFGDKGRKIICRFEQGEWVKEEYFEAMKRLLGIPNIPEDAFWRIHNASMMQIDPDVVNLLLEVRRCNHVKIVAVTDTDVSRMFHIDRILQNEHRFRFDHVVTSFNANARKVDRSENFWCCAIRETAAYALHAFCHAQDCLVVDDNPDNAAFASSLQFRTHVYRDAQLLRHIFNLYGLFREPRRPSAHP